MYELFKKALEEGRIVILDKPERVLTTEDFKEIFKGRIRELTDETIKNMKPLTEKDLDQYTK